jgi:predicted nucleotidyltransferase
MTYRDQILATLRSHAPELRAAGLAHLRLFGSASRDEATPQSDIDLIADYDPEKTITLVTLGRLDQRLRDILKTDIDLCSADLLKPHVRERALREAVLVF